MYETENKMYLVSFCVECVDKNGMLNVLFQFNYLRYMQSISVVTDV